MRIMAIDYGDAHTGIAISDPTGLLTGISTTIDAYRSDVLVGKIAALVHDYNVEKLVLGYPRNMDGTPGSRAEKTESLAALLRDMTHLPVILWDERRTTISAYAILRQNGKNTRKGKKKVDAIAASLILENYLESLKR